LNQVEFAARLNWDRGVVERIESKQQIPTYLEAIDWADACGVTEIGLAYRYSRRKKRGM
jgi:hypothetical protein